MEIFDKHPELETIFYTLCQTRRDEIIAHMIKTDKVYESLRRNRADISMDLKKVIANTEADMLFEKYSDAVYAQEVYELDTMYKQAFCDALNVLNERGIIDRFDN